MYTYNKWVLTNDKSIHSKSEETFSLTHCGGNPLWLGENGSLHLAHADTMYLYGRWLVSRNCQMTNPCTSDFNPKFSYCFIPRHDSQKVLTYGPDRSEEVIHTNCWEFGTLLLVGRKWHSSFGTWWYDVSICLYGRCLVSRNCHMAHPYRSFF